MSDKTLDDAISIFTELTKEQMALFLIGAKDYLKNFDKSEEDDEEDDIDKIKSDLELAYAEHATTYRMIRKVYFGEAKIVYDVYGEDVISFEDNDGEFLW